MYFNVLMLFFFKWRDSKVLDVLDDVGFLNMFYV